MANVSLITKRRNLRETVCSGRPRHLRRSAARWRRSL